MSHRTRPRASDHRAVVLEEIATSPVEPSMQEVTSTLAKPDFTQEMVYKMVYQLLREGLIGRREGQASLFITEGGLDYLTNARFDLPLQEPGHPRPGARRRKTLTK